MNSFFQSGYRPKYPLAPVVIFEEYPRVANLAYYPNRLSFYLPSDLMSNSVTILVYFPKTLEQNPVALHIYVPPLAGIGRVNHSSSYMMRDIRAQYLLLLRREYYFLTS